MHTKEYRYTRKDKLYADDSKTDLVHFHYDSDLSGEVIIENEIAVIRVPGWMLMEFVGDFIRTELISTVEDWSGREMLYALQRGIS